MELARLHIYHVLGLSFQKTADVFHNAVQKPLAAFQRRPCHVGRDDAVGRGQKGIARRDGFFGYYVHSGGAETAAFQRGFYRRFVHETVSALMSFAVAGVRGQWRETKSDWASRVSRSTYFASASPPGRRVRL